MSSRGREGDGGAELFQRHGRRLVQAVTHATLVRRRRTQRATTSAGDEQMNERVAKLLAHRAVEEKVDAVVGESQDVEEVTEAGVDLVDEVIEQAVQEVGDALRELSDEEFSDEEQNDDQQQHASCTRVRSGTPVIVVIHRGHLSWSSWSSWLWHAGHRGHPSSSSSLWHAGHCGHRGHLGSGTPVIVVIHRGHRGYRGHLGQLGSGTPVISALTTSQHLSSLFGDLESSDEQSAEDRETTALRTVRP